MSRRCHHGSPRHLRQIARERRRGPALADRPPIAPSDQALGAPAEDAIERLDEIVERADELGPEADPRYEAPPPDDAATADSTVTGPATPSVEALRQEPTSPSEHVSPSDQASGRALSPAVAMPAPAGARIPPPARAGSASSPGAMPVRPPHRPREAAEADPGPGDPGLERGATAPQLRRFIKSRAYVPMHELRRRFAINGGDDDVIPLDVDRQRVFVGLPPREGSLLGELLRAGDIGYELSLDPIAPIVVGVYPMRPVPRS